VVFIAGLDMHKRSVLLSFSIVFVAGLDTIAKGLSVCVIGFGASIRKRSVLLSRFVVFVVGFGGYMKGLSFCRAFCRNPSF